MSANPVEVGVEVEIVDGVGHGVRQITDDVGVVPSRTVVDCPVIVVGDIGEDGSQDYCNDRHCDDALVFHATDYTLFAQIDAGSEISPSPMGEPMGGRCIRCRMEKLWRPRRDA